MEAVGATPSPLNQARGSVAEKLSRIKIGLAGPGRPALGQIPTRIGENEGDSAKGRLDGERQTPAPEGEP